MNKYRKHCLDNYTEYPILDRCPDVVLPEDDTSCKVEIWIEEKRFRLDNNNVTFDCISREPHFKNLSCPIIYLEFIVADHTSFKKARVAVDYFAEQALLNDQD